MNYELAKMDFDWENGLISPMFLNQRKWRNRLRPFSVRLFGCPAVYG